MVEGFEDEFQWLILLQGVEAGIDQFAAGYALLLGAVREEMGRARTVEGVRSCAGQFRRMRSLLLEQIGYVKGLKEAAMMDDESLAELPAIEALSK